MKDFNCILTILPSINGDNVFIEEHNELRLKSIQQVNELDGFVFLSNDRYNQENNYKDIFGISHNKSSDAEKRTSIVKIKADN